MVGDLGAAALEKGNKRRTIGIHFAAAQAIEEYGNFLPDIFFRRFVPLGFPSMKSGTFPCWMNRP